MSRWFRFYNDAVNDPKVQRLPGEKFKAWINLLCLACKHDGVLPPLVDIAFSLRMSEEKVSALLNDLCAAGLLDPIEVENAPMSYAPHNWDGRQYKSDVTDPTAPTRQKRYRDRKRNATVTDRNATVTVERPEQRQITETEKISAAPNGAQVFSLPNPEADYFRRTKEILGTSAGGIAKRLLTAKENSVPLARAAIEQASTKENPREYIGAIIRGREEAECRPDRSF